MASRSKGTTKGLNGRILSGDKTYAANAQEQFQKVAKDTANLDVLARCKKLNEFLASVSLFALRGGKCRCSSGVKPLQEAYMTCIVIIYVHAGFLARRWKRSQGAAERNTEVG